METRQAAIFQQPLGKGGESMDCEKIRDRFSSLWEKELSPFEEATLREHLSSCPTCQREFEQFGKTMQWLHAVGEVEAPEEFLPELYQKLEDRKKALPTEKSGGRWLHFPLSYKLPLQAVAMVAVVFLVLYISKSIPIDGYRQKEPERVPSPLLAEKKAEEALGRGEVERPRKELKAPRETPRPRDVEQANAPVPKAGKLEVESVPQVKAEAKKTQIPLPSTYAIGYPKAEPKEEAAAAKPPLEPGRMGSGLGPKERSIAASRPPQEITLRTSDRGNTISRLNDLVRQLGGNVIAVERDGVLASLPTASMAEFEKKLGGLSPSGKADFLAVEKDALGSLRFQKGMKEGADGEKSKDRAKSVADTTQDRSTIRIRLLQE